MTIVSSLPFTLQNGTVADATQVMANLQGIVDDVNANAAANGANNDITSLLGLTTPLGYASGGSSVYIGGTSTGTANAQVVASLVPDGLSLTAGKRAVFIAGFTNTAAATLNANALGVKNIYKITPAGPVALTGGEIVVGNVVEVVYDGTQYQLISNLRLNLLGTSTDLADSATPDLGTIASHNVNLLGTTTITAFGSSASLIYPIYFVKFAGIRTLTHNGTSLIIPGALNVTTAVNDVATLEYLGSGNWRVIGYQRANGINLNNGGNANIAGGFSVTSYNAGTKSSGTFTPSPLDGNLQYATNGGAHTLAAPTSDCAINILYTNNASAGTITFSGFTVSSNTGDTLTTTNTSRFLIQIVRINGVSTYVVKALQ